jgi:hypothetical protein
MSNTANSIRIDFFERFKNIDGTDVIPDGFHRAAAVVSTLDFEVVRIVSERRIIRDQANETEFGEFMSVVQVFESSQTGWFTLCRFQWSDADTASQRLGT